MPSDCSGEPERIHYDDQRELYRASFDADAEPVTDVVVRTVSAVTGTELEEMDPIDGVVDPIIFDALVRRRRRQVEVGFTYHGHEVIVDTDGEVIVLAASTDDSFDCAFQFDDSDSAVDTVVRALAALQGVDETDIDPLYEVIDPEALDALFTDAEQDDVTVSFRMDEFWIELRSEASVRIMRTSG